ncbi:MAG: cytochrome c biogenesis protein CcsA [Bacteroidetes bacterium]|nr:cytochrome c biogenesis protein CcsA [Bacteroidota bacterium]
MDSSTLHFLNGVAEVFLPIGYVMAAFLYAMDFRKCESLPPMWKTWVLRASVTLHFIYIGMHTAEYGRCMVTTPFEIMSLIAFTIAATYMIIEQRTGESGTGSFIVALAALFELTSAVVMKMPGSGAANPVLSNMSIGLHVSFAVLGYAAFALSAVYGVLYLLMYRELKRGSTGSIYRNMPSLETLERMTVLSSLVGFVFLTVSMIIGLLWLPRIFADFSYTDPKLLVTALVWLLYAAMLVAHYFMHVEGKRIVRLAIWGFAFSLLSMTVVNAFLSDFHRFL